MRRKPLTEKQRESHRKANREYAARNKKPRDHPSEWKARKNKRNAARNDKYERDWQKQRRAWERAMLNIFGDLIDCGSLIGGNSLKEDRTSWHGPGWRTEKQLEQAADNFLQRNAKRKKK